MRFDPRDFVFVWTNAVEIGAVRAREQIGRLKKMNVSVDVTRRYEFSDALDLFPERRRVLLAHRDALNLVAIDHDRRVRQYFAVRGVNHRRSDKGDFLGVRRDGGEQHAKAEKNSHSFDSGTAFSAA